MRIKIVNEKKMIVRDKEKVEVSKSENEKNKKE